LGASGANFVIQRHRNLKGVSESAKRTPPAMTINDV
jgi:hypothetical protein